MPETPNVLFILTDGQNGFVSVPQSGNIPFAQGGQAWWKPGESPPPGPS